MHIKPIVLKNLTGPVRIFLSFKGLSCILNSFSSHLCGAYQNLYLTGKNNVKTKTGLLILGLPDAVLKKRKNV